MRWRRNILPAKDGIEHHPGSLKRVIMTAVLVLVILSTLFSGIYLLREYTKVYRITHMGDMWSFVSIEGNSSFPPFVEIDPDDFPHPPYPVRGDLLVTIDGMAATASNYFEVFSTHTPPGRIVEIRFMHEGVTYMTDIITRTIPGNLKFQIWAMFLLRSLITLGLLLSGIWGLVRRSASPAVRALALFCSALAVNVVLTSTIVSHPYASFQLPVELVLVFGLVGLSSSSFWLKLNLLFPETSGFYSRHRFHVNALIFMPVLAAGLLTAYRGIMPPQLWMNIYHTIYLAAGFILLVRNHAGADTLLEKRQTRLVMMGSFLGVLFYILYGWFRYVAGISGMQIPVQTNMLLANLVFLFLLPIPVSLLYSFRKYNLLQVEGRLRRGTRFLAVNLLLILFFFGVLYLFGDFVLGAVGIRSKTPTLVLGLILALSFMPTQRRLRSRIEDHFYPERRRLRELLRDFLASGAAHTEEATFWDNLRNRLQEGLAAESIYPVLRIEGGSKFIEHDSEPAPFESSDELIGILKGNKNSILLDELMESGRISLTDNQREWFESRRCAVIMPLLVSSGLVGFLAIGCKRNGEDFSAEELELLGSFSAQIALVAENLHLLREKIESQKLQEQLSVARDIQRKLLPGEIPAVEGIEMSARMRFCLEVAGDYYDVMKLDDNRVLLAVGDVSGKGVGPALLMANLQASLRTTKDMGASLPESAARINSLIFDNTPPEMFITFFLVSMDPASRRIKYVNAGHNPPILLRGSGKLSRLESGGLAFGIVRDAEYMEGSEQLEPGDTLLMYTDGVSEAMDGDGEEFGESRMEGIMRQCSRCPLDEMLDRLEDSVEGFQGSSEFADDFTLLALRIPF